MRYDIRCPRCSGITNVVWRGLKLSLRCQHCGSSLVLETKWLGLVLTSLIYLAAFIAVDLVVRPIYSSAPFGQHPVWLFIVWPLFVIFTLYLATRKLFFGLTARIRLDEDDHAAA